MGWSWGHAALVGKYGGQALMTGTSVFGQKCVWQSKRGRLLRHGLEQSRRERGADHEETLAHLAALPLHLESAGKPVEAAAFKKEHDELAARVEAKKKEMTS